MSKIAKFSHPRIIYCFDLHHRITDPHRIWWTYRLIINAIVFDFLLSLHLHITSDGV